MLGRQALQELIGTATAKVRERATRLSRQQWKTVYLETRPATPGRRGAAAHPEERYRTRLTSQDSGVTYLVWIQGRPDAVREAQLSYFCSCPYEWGGPCKHVTAFAAHLLTDPAVQSRGQATDLGLLLRQLTQLDDDELWELLTALQGERPEVVEPFITGAVQGLE